jgi:chromosome segregation ATPase
MSRLLVSAAVIVLMFATGCTMITDVKDPEQLRARAETLRTRAAGSRKSAREYEALLKKSEEQVDLYQTRLEAYRKQRAELDERIEELRIEKSDLSPQERDRLQPTIRNYVDEREAVQAKLDEQLIRIRRLKNQIEHQRSVKNTHLRKARKLEEEARRLEKYARRREQQT